MTYQQRSSDLEVADGDLYGICVAGFRGSDRLASRDTYDTWSEAADIASAMADQDCGEKRSPGYYVVRLEPVYCVEGNETRGDRDA